MGDQDPQELSKSMAEISQRARKNFRTTIHDDLRKMIQDKKDLFQTKMGSDPSAQVLPLQIDLKRNPRHNSKTRVCPYRLIVSYYVVVSRDSIACIMESTNLVGKFRITSIKNNYVFLWENLLTKVATEVHISRVRPYHDDYFGSLINMMMVARETDRV